ncbi:E3 ubiquitin-protein ligase TRIM11-like isoform X2 [Rhineura floridana]|uniref:E3 ubiquitin-protein ligase TRIM11-like isoform X2 n=1 Tax=Rhineura floridana TaxID=261503 RepID=UPI002AC886FD|nr:E3 ubiquitin-protein ligase TRIM11-like isoform X2 [Rhineura floridana]
METGNRLGGDTVLLNFPPSGAASECKRKAIVPFVLHCGSDVMATESPRKRLHREATCPVCLGYFVDPVTLDCGHNFCQTCVSRCWEEPGTGAKCPHCRMAVGRNFRSNRSLANVVEIAQQLNSSGVEGPKCITHPGGMNYFCKDHGVFFCMVCDAPQQHRCRSTAVPIEQAVHDYKGQIFSCLGILRKERGTILEYIADLEEKSQYELEQIQTEKEITVFEFRRLYRFLKRKEKFLVGEMVSEERNIVRIKERQLSRFSEKLLCLGGFIQDMEELCQKPEIEFLQDVQRVLQRYEKKKKPFEYPVSLDYLLKWRIQEFCDRNFFLEGVLQEFKDGLAGLHAADRAIITLDPKTASPQLTVSTDCKSVRHGGKDQDLPNNPERICCDWPFVMGREEFEHGRHIWDVLLGSEGDWAVGVALQNNSLIPFRDEIWEIGKGEGGYWVSCHIDFQDRPLSLSGELNRIRVSLNCDGGRLAFFNADSGAELFAFKDVQFLGATIFPFFRVSEKGYLTLSP